MPGKRRKTTCQCSQPAPRDILSGGGENLGQMCNLCTLPIHMRCAKCKRAFLSIAAHLRLSDCGKSQKTEDNVSEGSQNSDSSELLGIIKKAGFDLVNREHDLGKIDETSQESEDISNEVPM